MASWSSSIMPLLSAKLSRVYWFNSFCFSAADFCLSSFFNSFYISASDFPVRSAILTTLVLMISSTSSLLAYSDLSTWLKLALPSDSVCLLWSRLPTAAASAFSLIISPSLSPSRSLVSSMNFELPLVLVELEVYKAVLSIGSGLSNSFLASRMADCSSSTSFYSSCLYLELFLTTLGVFFSTAL